MLGNRGCKGLSRRAVVAGLLSGKGSKFLQICLVETGVRRGNGSLEVPVVNQREAIVAERREHSETVVSNVVQQIQSASPSAQENHRSVGEVASVGRDIAKYRAVKE
jgi:hypothetical protein